MVFCKYVLRREGRRIWAIGPKKSNLSLTPQIGFRPFHSCSLDAKIKNNLEAQVVGKPSEVTKKPPIARWIQMHPSTLTLPNPDSKDVKKVVKEGGEKWKLLTDEEKKSYMSKLMR
ncbi:hypothetical protein ACLB2K_002461 [Fragaria x ananassa]